MYERGKSYPLQRPRGIVAGPDIVPVWYGLIVPPQKERATCEHLKKRGVYAFFPSEERIRTIRGKRQAREHPIVSRYVYAQFRQAPQWDILKEKQRLITGVFSVGDMPVQIPSPIIKHLQGLTVEAERLREARAELLRVRAGDKATITEGPLQGFLVDVNKVSDGMAWFSFLTGGRGRAKVATLERKI